MSPTIRSLLLASLVALLACQKNEQSSVQPEKLAEGSASAMPGGSATGEPAKAGGEGPAPLVPYASGKAPAAPASAAPGVGAPPKKDEVRLVDPGKEPRRELRLSAKVGQADKMKMTMTMDMDIQVGAQAPPKQQLPPMVMNMAMKVTDTKPNGDIRYEFTLTDTDVKTAPGMNPQVTTAIKEALGKLNGLNGHAVVSNRGFNREAKINMPPGSDAQTKQVMQGMEQAMQQIGAPLPEEPVGVGARWQYITQLTQNGIRIDQTATYDLVKMEGERISCKVTVDQSAPRQKVASPVGVTVDLLSMKSDGGGATDLELTKLAPIKSNMKLRSKVEMSMPQNQVMKMATNMVIDIVSP